MQIKDVENLARLARIELDEAEKEGLLKDFESILGYVQQIEEVELPKENTVSVGQTEGLYNAWREDEETPREFSRELITGQFPDSQDGFLKVKKIL